MFLEPAQHADMRDAARAAAAKRDADFRTHSLRRGALRADRGQDDRNDQGANDHSYLAKVALDVAPPLAFMTEMVSVPSPNS